MYERIFRVTYTVHFVDGSAMPSRNGYVKAAAASAKVRSAKVRKGNPSENSIRVGARFTVDRMWKFIICDRECFMRKVVPA